MPKGYKHLTYDIRCQMYALLKRNFSQSQIAKDLNVSQPTISRELKRNKGNRGYRYKQAQKKASIRRTNAKSNAKKMTPDIIMFLKKKLQEYQWSPEQLSGYLKKEHKIFLSHESIYKYIWKDKQQGGTLYKNLRCSGKKYNKRSGKNAGRGLIPNRVGIENRPSIVDQKQRVGDFEMDTIIGAHHRGAIVSLVDRRTKLTRLQLIDRSTADQTSNAIITLLSPIKKHLHTITTDNGKEFAKHQDIACALRVSVYFANPYCAWERGLNENTNRLVRQYFPKKCDFSKLTHEQVQYVEYLLNTRPRKTLNFKSPIEVFLQLTGIKLNYALRI
jgi:transposase, IS30 family